MRKVIALTALALSVCVVMAASGINKSLKPDGSIRREEARLEEGFRHLERG